MFKCMHKYISMQYIHKHRVCIHSYVKVDVHPKNTEATMQTLNNSSHAILTFKFTSLWSKINYRWVSFLCLSLWSRISLIKVTEEGDAPQERPSSEKTYRMGQKWGSALGLQVQKISIEYRRQGSRWVSKVGFSHVSAKALTLKRLPHLGRPKSYIMLRN